MDKFFNTFKLWLPYAKKASREKLKYLWINGGGEFISTGLKSFYNERRITIDYIALYVHEEYGIAK